MATFPDSVQNRHGAVNCDWGRWRFGDLGMPILCKNFTHCSFNRLMGRQCKHPVLVAPAALDYAWPGVWLVRRWRRGQGGGLG
ncbi:hypothetical protein ABIA73_000421 [Stenotrophomonas sp. 2694]